MCVDRCLCACVNVFLCVSVCMCLCEVVFYLAISFLDRLCGTTKIVRSSTTTMFFRTQSILNLPNICSSCFQFRQFFICPEEKKKTVTHGKHILQARTERAALSSWSKSTLQLVTRQLKLMKSLHVDADCFNIHYYATGHRGSRRGCGSRSHSPAGLPRSR